jgi:hypothetical protein
MVAPPVRGADAFGVTVNVAGPEPTPLLGAAVIQSTPELAVHGQPAPVVTAAVIAPPLPPIDCEAGATL